MIFIYKITEVNFCMPLRKYQDMTLTANDAVSSPLSLRPNRKLILIAIRHIAITNCPFRFAFSHLPRCGQLLRQKDRKKLRVQGFLRFSDSNQLSQSISLIYKLAQLAGIGKSLENLLKTSCKVAPAIKVAHIFWWRHDNRDDVTTIENSRQVHVNIDTMLVAIFRILLKISKNNLKIMFIRKYKNKHFDRNYPMGIFAWRGLYILYTFLSPYSYVIILMVSPLKSACSASFFIRRIIHSFKCVSFWLNIFCGKWEGWDPVNRFMHIRSVAVVTPTYRPKSVRNRCVIEVFGCVFVLSLYFYDFNVDEGALVIRLSQISYLFSCV